MIACILGCRLRNPNLSKYSEILRTQGGTSYSYLQGWETRICCNAGLFFERLSIKSYAVFRVLAFWNSVFAFSSWVLMFSNWILMIKMNKKYSFRMIFNKLPLNYQGFWFFFTVGDLCIIAVFWFCKFWNWFLGVSNWLLQFSGNWVLAQTLKN